MLEMLKAAGLILPPPPLSTLAYGLGGLALMLALSPLADALASRLIARPPTLGAFKAIQQSRLKLAAGIVVAWVLGAFLEELLFRGVVLQVVERASTAWVPTPVATGVGVLVAAIGAGACHLYQGPRAALIITQLSVLFGLVFVLSGHNLWAVILCHGLYDTIAFIRFAQGKSRYAKLPD